MQQIPFRLPQPIGSILLPGFALISYASATEPLRTANLPAGSALYEIGTLSVDGAPVRSSSGATVSCLQLGAGANDRLHTVFVCAGGQPGEWHHPPVHAALRIMARNGVRVGGISGGPYLLAAAGLLDGRDFTIHWEHAPALIEAFPHLTPRPARFVMDGNRITCGGGFLEIYRTIRLQHARRRLQSPLSISEIAYVTGFSSAAHFSTAYRLLFGHAPRRERD